MTNQNDIFLGFDLGASSVKYGYGNCQLGLLSFDSQPFSEKSLSHFQEVFARILAEVSTQLGDRKLRAVGIGTPGTIDLASGRIIGTNPNLPFWTGHAPAELLPPDLKLPVASDNDANLMCLGEAWQEFRRHKVVGITIGSGIGSGFVDCLQIYHGSRGVAMELGHVTVEAQGALCGCDRRGCLEAYASVDGIKARLREQLDPGLAKSIGLTGCNLRDLLRLPELKEEFEQARSRGMIHLAQAVANLILVLDPDAVIFGGGGMDGGLYDINQLAAAIQEHLPAVNKAHTKLLKAKLGNRAGVWGAIILAQQLIKKQWEQNLH